MAQRAETTVDEPSLSSCMSARLTDKFNVQSVVKIIPGQQQQQKSDYKYYGSLFIMCQFLFEEDWKK